MTLIRKLSWLPAAAIAAVAGVMLAVWMHEEPLPRPEAQPAQRADEVPNAPAEGGQSAQPGNEAGNEPAVADTAAPETDPAAELARLRDELLVRAGTDVEGALRALMALEAQQRSALAEEVISAAAATAPGRTLAWLSSNVPDTAQRNRLLAIAYTGLATRDPAVAMDATGAIEDPEARQDAQRQVLETWSEHDVSAAYEWARAQTGEGSGDMYATVMRGYMQQSPEQAAGLVASLPDGEERNGMLNHYARVLAAQDPRAALSWLSRFDGEAAHRGVTSAIVDHWAQREPWQALEYAATEVEGEESFELVGDIARGMGADAPDTLAGSLHRLPADYQPLAAASLAGAWAYSEPEAAQQWVESLPAGEVQNAARQRLEEVSRHRSSEQASAGH